MTTPSQSPSGRLRWAVAILPWLALVIFSVGLSQRIRPAWNLDAVFYAGASYSQTEAELSLVHRRVYEEVRRDAPAKSSEAIVSGSAYRKRVAGSVDAFAGQLPFYTAKPLYVAAITATRLISGEGAVASAFRVSQLGFVVLLVAVALAARRFASTTIAVVVGCVFGLGVPVVETAEAASPDTLCAALVVATYATLSRGHHLGGGLLGALAVLTRPDAVIFVLLGALLPTVLERPRSELRRAMLVAGGVVVASLLPSLAEGSYGWTMVMRQTFFGATTHIERLREPLSWSDYVFALNKGLSGHMSLNHGGHWPYLAASVGAGIVGLLVRAPRDTLRNASVASALCWVAAGVHVLAFPLIADRVLLPSYGMALLVVCAALSGWGTADNR